MSDLAEALEPPVPPEEIAEVEAKEVKEPEVKAEQSQEEPDKQKTVPHQALHEERQRRKEAEARMRQWEQERAVMADRYNQLLQATQKPVEVPDKNQQPLEYIDHTLNQTQRELQEMRQWQNQQAQFAQQQAQAQNLASWARNEASTFAADKPDFKGAYEHVLQLRGREFQAMGVPPQQIPAAIANYELGLFFQSHQAGRNPGEVIYEMAKGAGYSSKPAQGATEKIQNLNKGMEASKTLGNGGSQGTPTPEQIAAMSEDEFAVFKASLKGKRVSDVL